MFSSPVNDVLIVCSANMCRSPMAEGILKKMCHEAGLPLNIHSAGILNFHQAHAVEHAVQIAGENGVDLTQFRSSRIKSVSFETVDVALVMEDEHRSYLEDMGVPQEKIHYLGFFHRDPDDGEQIPDPIGGSLEDFEDCFARLTNCCTGFITRLRST